MNEITRKDVGFLSIYNRSCRLTAAIFMVLNVIDQDDELKTRIKNLSLSLISKVVNLKDIGFLDAGKLTADIERNSLELMSVLDIAGVSGLISKMNGDIIKAEFQFFVSELDKFASRFENNRNVSVKNIFSEEPISGAGGGSEKTNRFGTVGTENIHGYTPMTVLGDGNANSTKSDNGHKRKDTRRITILNFIKGHNGASIKDIAVNITGCSEKTVQRELVSLIREGKIKKTGERRWSKYSIIED